MNVIAEKIVDAAVGPAAPPRPCRFCGHSLSHVFADLGTSPLCQRHVEPGDRTKPEAFYPLVAWVCDRCWLVQLEEYVSPAEIFDDYAYFSSYSTSWLEHARRYVEEMVGRFQLSAGSKVVEIASNDGYLLQYFVQRGIGALGVEPAANVAAAAAARGIPTIVKFFGQRTARELLASYGTADLLLGNNVLAHVPDLNDFVAGMKMLLGPRGVITMEFPHLVELIRNSQFDTIYHEHFSYLSLTTVERVFARHGLAVFDVERLATHGGSLRVYARHAEDESKPIGAAVGTLKWDEVEFGITRLETYWGFQERVKATKRKLLAFLIETKEAGKTIVGYGAPGKGNTLLNYCGIRTDFLDYTVDRNPKKQGNYLPGSRIPIHSPEMIRQTRPDYVLILPWNLRDEITAQLAYVREWGCKFVVPIPAVEVF